MRFSARPAELHEILHWRDMYLLEMSCQVVHDAFHRRPGWTNEFVLLADGVPAGYGSVVVAGPWHEKPTIYEFFILPDHRAHVFGLFECLLTASGAVMVNVQTNDPSITVMLHTFTHDVTNESILFRDGLTTALNPAGLRFRMATSSEVADVPPDQLKWHGVAVVDGAVAATGGILFHYNRPYGDIYMDVAEPFRRRGAGSFLVQELKRVCYDGGSVPSARCRPDNVGSRATLQKAGFVPCGNILNGIVRR